MIHAGRHEMAEKRLRVFLGVRVAVTRQNGKGAETVIRAGPLLAVVVYGAVMFVADVITPSISDRVDRLAHGDAPRTGTALIARLLL